MKKLLLLSMMLIIIGLFATAVSGPFIDKGGTIYRGGIIIGTPTAPTGGSFSFTLGRDGATEAEFSWLDELNADTNYYGLTGQIYDDGAGGRNKVSLFWPELQDSFYNASISYCSLFVDPDLQSATTLQVHSAGILQTIVYSEVTWNSYSAGNSWATAGAETDGTDITSARFDTLAVGDTLPNGDMAFDITAWAQACDGADTSLCRGILLLSVDNSEQYSYILIAGPADNQADRPYIKVAGTR